MIQMEFIPYHKTQRGREVSRNAQQKRRNLGLVIRNRDIEDHRKEFLLKHNSPEYKARVALRNAVKDNKIIKLLFCEECGSGGTIHGHHADYTKVFEVDWLCAFCHGKRHWKKEGE